MSEAHRYFVQSVGERSWTVIEVKNQETIKEAVVCCRGSGAYASVDGNFVYIFAVPGSADFWERLRGIVEKFDVHEWSSLDLVGKCMLEEAVKSDICWKLASCHFVHLGDGKFVSIEQNQGGGHWKLCTVLVGCDLHVGWSWHNEQEERWCQLSLSSMVGEDDDQKERVLRVAVGAKACRGLYLGIAECSAKMASRERNRWNAEWNLRLVEDGFLAKVSVGADDVLLVPLELLFENLDGNPHQSSITPVAMTALYNWDGKVEIQAESTLQEEKVEPPSPLSKQSDTVVAINSSDSNVSVQGAATSSSNENGESEKVLEAKEEDDGLWREICDLNARLDSGEHDEGSRGMFRGMVLGKYVPLPGIVATKVLNGWNPSSPSVDVVAVSSEAEPRQKRHRKHKKSTEGSSLPAVAGEDSNKGVSVVHMLSQWRWPVSRKLFWPDALSAQNCFGGASFPNDLQLSMTVQTGVSSVVVVEEPRLRAKLDNHIVDMDMMALQHWDKLRLCPIVPAKAISFVVFYGSSYPGSHRHLTNFFADVSSAWTSHNLGSHAPSGEALVKFSSCDSASVSHCIRSHLASLASMPKIVYVVWPSKGDIVELSKSLHDLGNDCSSLVQVVPESFVYCPASWGTKALREFCFSAFCNVRMFDMPGVSCEPAYVISHSSFAIKDHVSLHVAFSNVGNKVIVAATDPTGEVWITDILKNDDEDDIASCLFSFVQKSVPQVPGLTWRVCLIDCNSISRAVFLPDSLACDGVVSLVTCAVTRNTAIAVNRPADARGSHTLAQMGHDTFVLEYGSNSLVVRFGNGSGVDERVVKELLLMMEEGQFPKHISFAWTVNKQN